ncbi:hypothetical protein LJ655_05160 [Paraburkholderia sp. MMS20-SJTN17]|uniref:O-antigen ligase domain-containing protein n=1 Tax=Paraburkholderia translucens TaxID=2886945 RepID=A0ABS8K988_9BURK|nr:hypothetical protein [Paraburkholderia sp. MMS20-SJTN17]
MNYLQIVALIVCVFLLQVGYTFHLSVAGAFFLVVMICGIRRLTVPALVFGLIGTVLIFLPIIFSPVNDFSDDALYRSLREGLGFFVIISLKNVRLVIGNRTHLRIKLAIWIITVGLLLITALQAIDIFALHSGKFFMPYSLFPGPIDLEHCWTLASCWSEFGQSRGTSVVIRPAATYAEPSYLGFVVLCLAFANQKVNSGNKIARNCITFIALIIVLLAQTVSGIVSLAIFLFVANWKYLSKNIGFLIFGAVFIIVSVLLLSGRFEALMGGSDESGLIRLVYPLQTVGEVFLQGYIFGIPMDYVPLVLKGAGAQGLHTASDNAFINMFILYGVSGLAVLAILFLNMGFAEIVFLLLCMQFNGVIFVYDKVVMISFALLLYHAHFQIRGASEPAAVGSTLHYPAGTLVDEIPGKIARPAVPAPGTT